MATTSGGESSDSSGNYGRDDDSWWVFLESSSFSPSAPPFSTDTTPSETVVWLGEESSSQIYELRDSRIERMGEIRGNQARLLKGLAELDTEEQFSITERGDGALSDGTTVVSVPSFRRLFRGTEDDARWLFAGPTRETPTAVSDLWPLIHWHSDQSIATGQKWMRAVPEPVDSANMPSRFALPGKSERLSPIILRAIRNPFRLFPIEPTDTSGLKRRTIHEEDAPVRFRIEILSGPDPATNTTNP